MRVIAWPAALLHRSCCDGSAHGAMRAQRGIQTAITECVFSNTRRRVAVHAVSPTERAASSASAQFIYPGIVRSPTSSRLRIAREVFAPQCKTQSPGEPAVCAAFHCTAGQKWSSARSVLKSLACCCGRSGARQSREYIAR